MQYTIRGIPETLDAALRERARAAGKSLNEVTIEALMEAAGASGAPKQRRNLDDIAGTWKADKAFDEAIAAQDQIDEDLWK
jgi:Antitoxin FitA-like, ribbon-helix-helix